MSAVSIDVQRLRLVAERGAGVQGLRARVEDALRISSKPPGLAHRFLLVRHLRLSLPREASAQSLSLRLEQHWRQLEALAQPMATAAADAEAVWAVDEVAARGALLRRWLDGEPAQAWFWQRLLPEAVLAQALAPRIAGLLFEPLAAPADSPSLAQALPQRLWREAWPQIVAAEQGAAVAAALSPAQRRALWQVLQIPDGRIRPLPLGPWVSPGDASSIAFLPYPREQATGSESPAIESSRSAPAVPDGVLPRSMSGLPARNATRPEPAPATQSDARRVSARRVAPTEPSPEFREDASEPAAHAARTADGQPTGLAGLWFLLPLLQQLGLAEQPDPARLLASLLQRAAMRHGLDAPALAWLAQFAQLDDERADDWWRRARRACVRRSRLPLRRLLHRPGRVWLSPHRTDLWLPLASADIRIRRAGFDIDPGYVPWLDCVIHFHYS
jgi:hypothetical protein